MLWRIPPVCANEALKVGHPNKKVAGSQIMMRGGSILMAGGISLLSVGIAMDDSLSRTKLAESINAHWMASDVLMIASGMILLIAGIGLSAVANCRRRKLALLEFEISRQNRSAAFGHGRSTVQQARAYGGVDDGGAIYYFAGAMAVFTIIVLSAAAYLGG